MSLEISLKAERAEVLMQDTALLTLMLRNAGASPLTVMHPADAPNGPVFRVRQMATGQIRTYRKPAQSAEFATQPHALDPGKEIEWKFWLRDFLDFPAPGDYEIAAEQEWGDGAGLAKSPPLAMKLLPVDPRWMAVTPAQSANLGEFHIYWTRAQDSKLKLMRSIVSNARKPEITEMKDLGDFPKKAEPILSDVQNKEALADCWLVWLDEGRLAYRLVTYEDPKDKDFAGKMPDASIRIIPTPLIRDTRAGEALLWLGGKKVSSAKIQIAILGTDGELHPGPELMLPITTEPRWASTAFLSTKERRGYFLWRDKGKLLLQQVAWSESGKFEPLKSLVELEGRFVGAGLSIQSDDRVTGIIVSLPEHHDDLLIFTPWTHQADGKFQVEASEQVPFVGADKIDACQARVNASGAAAVALRAAGQPWRLYQPGQGLQAVGGEVGGSLTPMALVFDRLQEPIFVFVRPGCGFFFADRAGLPPATTQRG